MIVTLEYPITVGERTVTELTIPDHPKVKHILAGDAYTCGTVAYELAVLEVMTGESVLLLKEMDFEDWIHVQAVLGSRFKNFYEKESDSHEKKSPQAQETAS